MRMNAQQAIELERLSAGRCPIHVRRNPGCSICARLSEELKAPLDAVEMESTLHNEIIQACKSRGWIYFHGSMAHKSRRTIGEPDFTIIADGGRVFFIECKAKNRKRSTEQMGVELAARMLGTTIHLVESMSQFNSIVTITNRTVDTTNGRGKG